MKFKKSIIVVLSSIKVKIFRKKKTFGKSKRQIFDIEDKNAGRGVRVAEARRRIVRHGDKFDWRA